MRYCTNCLNIDTRPNIKFTEEGLCPACYNYFGKKEVSKRQKTEELNLIKEFADKHNPIGPNCLIGVSGGKDSTRQALYVRDVLGLRPLLVSLNYPPEQISQIGANNLSNLISLGFDCINISCSPEIWRKLMRYGFYKFGNWAKSTEMALFASVPRVSVAYQIPLIWWGENAATVLGDLGVKGKSDNDGNRLKYSNTLQGGDVSWMYELSLDKSQILQYIYPSDTEMERAQMKILFLDYFMPDFSIYSNSVFSALYGIEYREQSPNENADFWGTSMLDEDFFIVNMMIKYLKFGFGRTSDNLNEHIRYGRITRQDAIRTVEKFDGNCSETYIEKFCEYIQITKEEFWNVVDRYVNKELFEKKNGKWTPKFKVGVGI